MVIRMNIKKTAVLVIAAALLLVVCTAAASAVMHSTAVNAYVRGLNAGAALLLEEGNTASAEMLASCAEQRRENKLSRTLRVLARGYAADYDGASALAGNAIAGVADDRFDKKDQRLARILAVIEAAKARVTAVHGADNGGTAPDETTKRALDEILADVKKELRANTLSGTEAVLYGLFSTESAPSPAMLWLSEDSLLAKRTNLLSAVKYQNWQMAYEAAEILYRSDKSPEHRAILANLAALGYRQDRNADGSGSDNLPLKSAEMARRAVNFLCEKTPLSHKDSTAYRLTLAHLHFRAGDEKAAAACILTLLKKNADAADSNRAAVQIASAVDPAEEAFLTLVKYSQSSAYGTAPDDGAESAWERLTWMLGLWEIPSDAYSDIPGGDAEAVSRGDTESESFFAFVWKQLQTVSGGLVITDVDTTQFPAVTVTVQMASALGTKNGKPLTKKDFIVTDMGSTVSAAVRMLETAPDSTSEESVFYELTFTAETALETFTRNLHIEQKRFHAIAEIRYGVASAER